MPFIEVFGALGLRRPGTTAIDVERLLGASQTHPVLGEAVGGVLAAIVALTDPTTVIIGGPWGADPAILDAIRSAFAHSARPVAVRAAAVTEAPALTGARTEAVSRLRSAVVADARPAR